tara:strand:+ start:427 stop:879 length:453 start_codon:yes stop_codon:yes gene_type:complete
MNFQFNKALSNQEETFQVYFSENEISKLITLKNMMEDIELMPNKTDPSIVIPISLDILPDSIDLFKKILNIEEIKKETINVIIKDYFQDKDNLMIKNTISSLLVFIDFMELDKEIEDIIYSISAYYLINLSKKVQETYQSYDDTNISNKT